MPKFTDEDTFKVISSATLSLYTLPKSSEFAPINLKAVPEVYSESSLSTKDTLVNSCLEVPEK